MKVLACWMGLILMATYLQSAESPRGASDAAPFDVLTGATGVQSNHQERRWTEVYTEQTKEDIAQLLEARRQEKLAAKAARTLNSDNNGKAEKQL